MRKIWAISLVVVVPFMACGEDPDPVDPETEPQNGTESPDVMEISCGGYHTCSRDDEGAVVCWGAGDVSDESDIAFGQSLAPDGPFVAVAAGGFHTCGIRQDGSVECWGAGQTEGQCLELGAIPPGFECGQSIVPDDAFEKVAAGYTHSCGLRPNGEVECWGNNHDEQSTAPPGSFLDVSCGAHHSCAVGQNNQVVCWGAGAPGVDEFPEYGQTAHRSVKVSRLSIGDFHTCALRTDGVASCWGAGSEYNDNGSWPHYEQAVFPTDVSFEQISAGGLHTCARTAAGEVICWGAGTTASNCVGVNFECGQSDPPPASFDSVSAGYLHTCGITSDGDVVCWGMEW